MEIKLKTEPINIRVFNVIQNKDIYIVEVIETEQNYQVWIGHTKYAVKILCLGSEDEEKHYWGTFDMFCNFALSENSIMRYLELFNNYICEKE